MRPHVRCLGPLRLSLLVLPRSCDLRSVSWRSVVTASEACVSENDFHAVAFTIGLPTSLRVCPGEQNCRARESGHVQVQAGVLFNLSFRMLSCTVGFLTLLIGGYRSLLRRGFHCRDSWLVLGVSPVRPQLAPVHGSSLREGDAFQSYFSASAFWYSCSEFRGP